MIYHLNIFGADEVMPLSNWIYHARTLTQSHLLLVNSV